VSSATAARHTVLISHRGRRRILQVNAIDRVPLDYFGSASRAGKNYRRGEARASNAGRTATEPSPMAAATRLIWGPI
jgi:hypothetical protein